MFLDDGLDDGIVCWGLLKHQSSGRASALHTFRGNISGDHGHGHASAPKTDAIRYYSMFEWPLTHFEFPIKFRMLTSWRTNRVWRNLSCCTPLTRVDQSMWSTRRRCWGCLLSLASPSAQSTVHHGLWLILWLC